MSTVASGTRIALLLFDFDKGIIARDATPWERLLARICATSLDRELARGASPDASARLALRARALLQPDMQRQLAARSVQVLAEGTGPVLRVRGSRIPIRRNSIQAAADLFQELIERLNGPGPLPVQGIAIVRNLLTDGAGPVYYWGSGEDLRRALTLALTTLEPRTAA